jgi:hypothetical protein
MSLRYDPAGAAACVGKQGTAEKPHAAGNHFEYVKIRQSEWSGGMRYKPAQAAECLSEWDKGPTNGKVEKSY